jgi:hypothetical protein
MLHQGSISNRFGWQRNRTTPALHERQDFSALIIEPKRPRTAVEPVVMEVTEQVLHGLTRRLPRASDGVSHLDHPFAVAPNHGLLDGGHEPF